jgi:hypothetical protein
MTRFITRLSTVVAIASVATGALAAGFPITAVPPATYRPAATTKATAPAMLLDAAVPAQRITLAAPSDAETAALRNLNASSKEAAAARTKAKALAIGIGRAVPDAAQVVALDALDWVGAADGSRAARIEVKSTGAAGVRVALDLSRDVPGLTVRFTGSTGPVFGPVDASAMRADTQKFGHYWSPVVEGEVLVAELAVPAGTSVAGARASIPLLSHSLVPAAELRGLSVKRVVDIGSSLPCERDLKCENQSPPLTDAANAVAAITFTKPNSGGLYLCTGQLLNDSVADNVPYFFTANHCIDSAGAAATISTYWFFDATACNSRTVRPDYVVQAAGSRLIARSPDWDWALVRLNAAPPAGATFSAWRAEAVDPGTSLTVLHHPNGDLKKISFGNAGGYVVDGLYSGSTPATFLYMTYVGQGQTEGGSSGSGVLSYNATGNYFEVRGGLYNGLEGACPAPAGYYDVYSRLDNMVPLVREHLTPGNNPAGTVAAVEFYNAALDHYFLSTNPFEINDLDSGVHPGWARTGIRFNAYATPVAGTSPVCRFYRAPAYGDSHFYSASPKECADTASQHPLDWVYESAAVFYILLPDPSTGACPAGTRPVWRFFNTVTTNHRYTPEVKLRDDMRFNAGVWIPEGYGPDAVIMCSPVGL